MGTGPGAGENWARVGWVEHEQILSKRHEYPLVVITHHKVKATYTHYMVLAPSTCKMNAKSKKEGL